MGGDYGQNRHIGVFLLRGVLLCAAFSTEGVLLHYAF